MLSRNQKPTRATTAATAESKQISQTHLHIYTIYIYAVCSKTKTSTRNIYDICMLFYSLTHRHHIGQVQAQLEIL